MRALCSATGWYYSCVTLEGERSGRNSRDVLMTPLPQRLNHLGGNQFRGPRCEAGRRQAAGGRRQATHQSWRTCTGMTSYYFALHATSPHIGTGPTVRLPPILGSISVSCIPAWSRPEQTSPKAPAFNDKQTPWAARRGKQPSYGSGKKKKNRKKVIQFRIISDGMLSIAVV